MFLKLLIAQAPPLIDVLSRAENEVDAKDYQLATGDHRIGRFLRRM